MSKKTLNERLEALLSDLTLPLEGELPEGETLRGWTWQVDAEGRYTACSPEVESVLGIPAEQFVGQRFDSFAVASESQSLLRQMLQSEHLPATLTVMFLKSDGGLQPVQLHLTRHPKGGWRGAAFLLSDIAGSPTSSTLVAESLLQGVRYVNGRIVPAEQPISPVAEQALHSDQAVVVTGGDAPSAIAVPLREQGQPVGLLELLAEPGRIWTEDDRRLVEQVADQLTLALENARLFQQTQAALAETEALYRASAALSGASSLEDVLEVLRHHTVLGDECHNLSLNLFNRPWEVPEDIPEWVYPRARWTQLPEEAVLPRYPLSRFPAARLLRPDQPLLVEDVQQDPRLDEQTRALYLQRFRAGSTILAPLNASGRWIGYVNAMYPQPRTFSAAEVRRMMAVVSQAASAVATIVQTQTAERRALLDRLSREVVTAISQAEDMETVLRTAARMLAQALGVSHALVHIRSLPEGSGRQPSIPVSQEE